MKATLLDTETGDRRTVDGPRSWEWAKNNWSCDCNRVTAFGDKVFTEMDRRSRVMFPDMAPWQATCFGCKRFIVVAAEFDDDDEEYTLAELNADYPAELLAKHGGCDEAN